VVEGTRPSEVVRWIRMNGWRSLDVAGNRESSNPGIGARVEIFMLAVFGQLARG
jgi:Circularly permutated YpsA SLOG family